MKLNLGGGPLAIEGFKNVDVAQNADFYHDLSVRPWPFGDESCEALLASHILEHFDKAEGRLFLRECWRILESGGILGIAVPDMDKFITAHLTGNFAPLEGYAWTNLNNLMGGGGLEPVEAMRHRYMYTWESLAWALTEEGFTPSLVTISTSALGHVHTGDYRAISLYIDARKP